MKIVSACLAGARCKYDGEDNHCPKVMELVEKGQAIPVCPEQLGGLPTPRDKAEKKDDKIVTINGEDVTVQFEKGADEALKIAKLAHCTEAILKAKSPSCGSGKIYDGTFTKTLVDDDGLFAQKLKENNIKVSTDEEI